MRVCSYLPLQQPRVLDFLNRLFQLLENDSQAMRSGRALLFPLLRKAVAYPLAAVSGKELSIYKPGIPLTETLLYIHSLDLLAPAVIRPLDQRSPDNGAAARVLRESDEQTSVGNLPQQEALDMAVRRSMLGDSRALKRFITDKDLFTNKRCGVRRCVGS
jgi:hypothetical protein